MRLIVMKMIIAVIIILTVGPARPLSTISESVAARKMMETAVVCLSATGNGRGRCEMTESNREQNEKQVTDAYRHSV